MKFQTKPWKCGPACVRNTLRAFGIKQSEDYITSVCGTTKNGTDEHGIMAALKDHGLHVTEYTSSSKKHAWNWLHGTLLHGEAVILCVQAWEHWVVCVGTAPDNRVTIVDSSNFKYNKSENGVHAWTREWLMYQWWNARKSVPDGEDRLYAIAVSKKRR